MPVTEPFRQFAGYAYFTKIQSSSPLFKGGDRPQIRCTFSTKGFKASSVSVWSRGYYANQPARQQADWTKIFSWGAQTYFCRSASLYRVSPLGIICAFRVIFERTLIDQDKAWVFLKPECSICILIGLQSEAEAFAWFCGIHERDGFYPNHRWLFGF